MSAHRPPDNLRGGAWLIADMSLNIWALSIVKALGADYPAVQVVFLRALVGLAVLLPFVWRGRHGFNRLPHLRIHALRVALSVVTLTASFYAIARVPLALFTAVGFTRPLVTMILAALILREPIRPRRWLAAALALAGVLIAVRPGAVGWSWGLAALGVVVLAGSGAVIATRRLGAAPPLVLMTFYTGGLSAVTAVPALLAWQPIGGGHLLPLLAVGLFSQAAQLCFLRAHALGEVGVLSLLSYLSLVLSVGVGVLVFNEVPTPGFWIGAGLVIAAALWGTIGRTRPPAVQTGLPRDPD